MSVFTVILTSLSIGATTGVVVDVVVVLACRKYRAKRRIFFLKMIPRRMKSRMLKLIELYKTGFEGGE